MSTSNSSDPRLLLPEWLRDGDLPASAKSPLEPAPAQPASNEVAVEAIAVVEPAEVPAPAAPATPFSDRLSLDTRLDPGLLVSAADLPMWLGGLDRIAPTSGQQSIRTSSLIASAVAVVPAEDQEPYDEADAPRDGVIDVDVNGWVMIAGAVGLLILLAAALKLYLS